MRLVHYQYKPEFAATVGIENTAETGNDFIHDKFTRLALSSHVFVHSLSFYHLNISIYVLRCLCILYYAYANTKKTQQTDTQIHQCAGHEYSLCPDNLVLDTAVDTE